MAAPHTHPIRPPHTMSMPPIHPIVSASPGRAAACVHLSNAVSSPASHFAPFCLRFPLVYHREEIPPPRMEARNARGPKGNAMRPFLYSSIRPSASTTKPLPTSLQKPRLRKCSQAASQPALRRVALRASDGRPGVSVMG
ncbi:uncharacterized protein BKA78DRAFT_165429 [Phyllosticta capitalensis]|uniref:uncharacterized protein n=1 Tax=Phyllosticta capitalensis TaxID=121624 RepID=UPI00312E41B1